MALSEGTEGQCDARIGMFTDIRMIRTPSRPSSSRLLAVRTIRYQTIHCQRWYGVHLSAAGQQTHCMLLQL